ncbi:MAG: hypothetical protein AB1758_33890 [Candidatus Eremiobacterota bacterium]
MVVEEKITRSAVNKLEVYAALGVPELWRYRPGRLTILRLQRSEYVETDRGAFLPVDAEGLSPHMGARETTARTAWMRALREWIRSR